MRRRSRKQRSNRRRGKLGTGLISGVVNKVRSVIRKLPPETLNDIADVAKITLGAARRAVQGSSGRSKTILPNVIPISKRGGILPLIPLVGALGGVGMLADGICSVINAIRNIRSGSALRKGGRTNKNIYVTPYRKGYGLYLRPWSGPTYTYGIPTSLTA